MVVRHIANSNSWRICPDFLGTTEDEWPNKQIGLTTIHKDKKKVGQKSAKDCNHDGNWKVWKN